MSSITIFREITLKQIVTEASKELTRQQLKEQLLVLNEEQMNFEEGKNKTLTEFSLKGADAPQINKIRQQFDTEAGKYYVRRDEIRMDMLAVDELTVGEEIIIGTVEGPYELKVGENLTAAVKAEIIVKDGIVVEIRK